MADQPFDDVFPRPDDDEEAVSAAPDDETPDDELLDDELTDEPDEDTPDANAPQAATPPRIVAETPIGGKTPRVIPPVAPPNPEDSTLPDRLDVTTEPPAADEPPPPGVSYHPDMETEPGDVQASELRSQRQASEPPSEPVPVDSEASTLIERQDESAAEPIPGATSPAPDSPAAPLAAAPSTMADTAGTVEADAAGPDEWDEDLSPELASILFASKSSASAAPPKPAPTPEAKAALPAPSAPAPATPAPADVPVTPAAPAEAPSEPVRLTDTADARRLHLTAGGTSAPPPSAALDGKVRYVRLEEPLSANEDEGQRLRETWSYYKSGLPGLAGRLVTEVEIEEITYADRSWRLRFERRYADRGRDRREVRANPDRTYIERKDDLSKIEADTGKRSQVREEAALIHAAPPQEDRRGFLDSLLGRDEDDSPKTGPELWREPTSSERRQARKEGGRAFRRSLLQRLLGR